MITLNNQNSKPALFFTGKRTNGQYLFDESKFISDVGSIKKGKKIYIPLAVDTEFYQPEYKDALTDKDFVNTFFEGSNYKINLPDHGSKGRVGVTTQISKYPNLDPAIFAHQDLVSISEQLKQPLRHPVANSGFHAVDYLNQVGFKASLRRVKITKKLPVCVFMIYSHFALAELMMIFDGEYKEDIIKIIPKHIDMKRRIKFQTQAKRGVLDTVDMSWVVNIDGVDFAVSLCIIDTIAVHNASYAKFCEACGVILEDKDLMDEVKHIMHLAYFYKPGDFDKYAIGDLKIIEALINNADNFKEIYEKLGLLDFYQPPKLSIGATVRDIFLAAIYNEFDMKPDNKKLLNKLIEDYCGESTSIYFKERTDSTMCLNAKVFGGRCRNNRPTLSRLIGALVDIDINGCYGEGQRNQLYPFGIPTVEHLPALEGEDNNDYLSLRDWLKKLNWGKKNCELVPGLWQTIVTTKPGCILKYEQDFIPSWFGFAYKEVKDMKTDTDKHDDFIDVKTGETKIFSNQIINGIITHDAIDWIENVCCQNQRNELLDNLFVKTAVYYATSNRVNSVEDLIEARKNFKGKNEFIIESDVDGNLIETTKVSKCKAWYAVNMGKFIINKLMFERKKHDKGTPHNTLYKLCINTLYGDMVSPYFTMGNVVVGNNITARARAMCYYAEKGFNGVQSITDGVVFELEKVVYPTTGTRLYAHNLVTLHRGSLKDKNIKFVPLGGYKKIKIEWLNKTVNLSLFGSEGVKILSGKNALIWLDKTALEHLQNLFDVTVLKAESTKLEVEKDSEGKPIKMLETERIGQYDFEMKSFYCKGAFHGSANYYLEDGTGYKKIAFRSYQQSKHQRVVIKDNQIELIDYPETSPPNNLMPQISESETVQRSVVFVKRQILKPKQWHKQKWLERGKLPGDSIVKCGLLREFSKSQFTFKTLEQYKAISKEVESNKRKFEQTYEIYFLDENGYLKYDEMIKTIDEIISSGEHSVNKVLDKSRHRHRKNNKHPELEWLKIVRKDIKHEEWQKDVSSDDDESLYIDDSLSHDDSP